MTLKKQYKLDIVCPYHTFKDDAWTDQQLESDQRVGLMTCYCKPLLSTLKQKIFDVSFSEFTLADGSPDPNKYCGSWAWNYAIQKGLVIGTSMIIVVINIITCTIFEKIVSVEKRHTANSETIGQF